MDVTYLRYQVSFQNITGHLKNGTVTLDEAKQYAKQLTGMDIEAGTNAAFIKKWSSEIKKHK